jgi:pilus assembly protein CpaF
MSIEDWIHHWFTTDAQGAQEVLVNGVHSCTAVDRRRGYLKLSLPFSDEAEFLHELQDFAFRQGKRLDLSLPAQGGDWSFQLGQKQLNFRWHAVIPPVSRDGPLLAIRHLDLDNLALADFQMDPSMAELVHKSIQEHRIVFFSGPTGSGKTSFLCSILRQYCQDERVVIAESLAEIPRLNARWVHLCAVPPTLEQQGAFSLGQVIQETLRLRPDRLVVGEVRGVEARALYQTLLAFGGGCLTTLHVDEPNQLAARLADLSGLTQQAWFEIFRDYEPLFVRLQRKKPRVSGAFQFKGQRFEAVSH